MLEIPFDANWVGPIETHLELLDRWSKRINLISRSDPTDAAMRHVLDSLTLLRLDAVRQDKTKAIDVGSGAGFPGMPLAIALPEIHWTLLEPRKKRGAFLTQVVLSTRLTNVEICRSRLPDPSLTNFDLMVSRATFAPEKLLELAPSVLAPEGVVVVMAATDPQINVCNRWNLEQCVEFTLAGASRWIGAYRLIRV